MLLCIGIAAAKCGYNRSMQTAVKLQPKLVDRMFAKSVQREGGRSEVGEIENE